jgi:TonB family protein
MQKIASFRALPLRVPVVMLCAVLPGAAIGVAQQPAAAADAQAIAQQVMQSNGLSEQSLQPWHIKITFKLLDTKGNTKDEGTFEEYWAGPEKFKRTFTSSGFTQTEFHTADGLRLTGTVNPVPESLGDLAREFVHPIAFNTESLDSTHFDLHELSAGSAKLSCLSAVRNPPANSSAMPLNETYCLSESAPILRIHLRGNGIRVLRNNIVLFQGKYLPRDIEAYGMGIPPQLGPHFYSAHLESAETIKTMDDALFVPPADAIKPPKQITLAEDAARAQLLEHPKAVYPAIAVAARVSGDVVLPITIGADGHVQTIRILDGPPMLRQAAIDAILQWTFKPFIEQGNPVTVSTVMTVKFRTDPPRVY